MSCVCPRREESGVFPGGPFKLPESDTFDGGRCSWCGSIPPDEFMALIEAERVEIGTTDKSYKVYVKDLESKGTRKFYFQHLSVEQRKRFVEIMNLGKLRFAGGLGFYVHPFFVVKAIEGARVWTGGGQ